MEKLNEILNKFTSTDLGNYGILPAAKSDEFINLTIDRSALLKAATIQRVQDRAGEYYSFELSEGVLRAAQTEGTTWPPQGSYDTGAFIIDRRFQYSCVKVVTALSMTWEMINWALPGPEFENFLVEQWQAKLKDSLERVAILGDTTSQDNELKIDDGWLKQLLTSTGNYGAHIIDWQNGEITPELWHTMRLELVRDPLARKLCKSLYWFCSPTVPAQYEAYLASRQDALGAAALMSAAEIRPNGIPFFNAPACVPYMPEVEETGVGLKTNIVLGDPKNFWLFIHRDFRLMREHVPLADLWRWIGYAYVDFVVPIPRAFVVAKNVVVIPA